MEELLLEKICFDKEDFEYLSDLILQEFRNDNECNPVVQFLSKKSGFNEEQVSDAFRYYSYFNRWSEMPFAAVIQKSMPKFWLQVYYATKEDGSIDYKKMFEIVTTHINSLP